MEQQKHKALFNIIEPSIVRRAQFASNQDASFSSYLHPEHHHRQQQQQRTEESDQISIFDAAEYFKGLHDDGQKEQAASPRMFEPSLMPRPLSVSSSTTEPSSYRARSFHVTPKSSSEVSWSSQTGLIQQPNPSGLMGRRMAKNDSPNTNNSIMSSSTKWGWLIPGRKCPCSGKKSVRVEDRTSPKTPRMVDLGRSSCSNGTNYPHSVYSGSQNSPKITSSNGNFGRSLVPKKFDYSTTTTTIAATNPVGNNPNGFSFPVLEDPPIRAKKMFSVIAPNLDPHRDSLEVYQPRSRRASYEEETALSDGSSDLFEIESFSIPNLNVKRFGGPVWRRSLEEETVYGCDDVESMAPTEGYAPTEFSVDWSVTTAEGFDRASLTNFSVSASQVGYSDNNNTNKRNMGSTISSSGNNGGGLLLSCRCEKAVNVGPGPGPMKCVGPGEGAGPRNLARHAGGRCRGYGGKA